MQCMEPINCMAQAGPDRLDLWTGTQAQDILLRECGAAGGLQARAGLLSYPYLGGGFGRKTQAEAAMQAMLTSLRCRWPPGEGALGASR
ncbi:molybdopterin cofactor-binding domain-containing protein [Variovorax sp. EBFNA2]|uniref:molybdopterin cofactor-binding domain-containing protein n=1 Tax=Variovorax sp. EBFNA2 TaxID=3342097 RepID=UPI00359F7E45